MLTTDMGTNALMIAAGMHWSAIQAQCFKSPFSKLAPPICSTFCMHMPEAVLWFTTWELSCPLVPLVSRKSKIPNRQTSAQDLWTGHQYIDTSQIRRQKPCPEIEVSYSTSFTQLAFDACYVFTGCSASSEILAGLGLLGSTARFWISALMERSVS